MSPLVSSRKKSRNKRHFHVSNREIQHKISMSADNGLRERKSKIVVMDPKDSSGAAPAPAPAASATREFTWQDVAQHNTAASAWVIIRGVVYDVTEWVHKHPGGSELILLHAGRECTDTFNSYHPFSKHAEKVLTKYTLGKLVGGYEFPMYKPDSGFYKECRDKVGDYFKTNHLNPKSSIGGLWRMTLVFAVTIVAYLGMLGKLWPGITGTYAQYFWAVVYGVCQALPLLHVMHDSSHAAISNSPFCWFAVGRGMMDWFAGGSMVSWLNQHVVGHHIYTNVAGADPDLPVNFKSDVRRIVARQALRPIYKFQHFYLPPLYGVLALKFRVQDFTDTFLTLTNGPVRVNPHAMTTWMHLIMAKSFWAFFRLWLPIYFFHVPTSTLMGTFFLAEFMTGWHLAFNFQVSHVSTECDYPCSDKLKAEINDEWAVSQVKSSVDYAHGSAITTFFAGALNYQVTHHLFPSVSQYHYPAIAPIIQDVCKKYNVKYTVLPSFTAAFLAHLKHLKVMGERGEPVSMHMG